MALLVDIRKQLGNFQLEVSFNAGDEALALLGASGCGKSVTLRCIAGILTPDEGRITLDGTVLYDSTAKISLHPQQRQMGYLFQQYALFPNMTVRQNIAVAVREKRQRQTVVDEKLQQFQLMDVAEKRPGQISGGQQQRTALARILASEPKAILLDEPFSALDSYLKYQLELELSETLERFPGTIIWVSHDRGELFRNCQRVCIMDQGRSQPPGSLEDLFRHPGTEVAARLSGCKNYANAVPKGQAVYLPEWAVTLTCPGLVSAEVGRMGVRAHHVQPAAPDAINAFPCTVVRVIEDVFSTIILLLPTGSIPGAPMLRMELDKDVWQSLAQPSLLTISILPEHILLL